MKMLVTSQEDKLRLVDFNAKGIQPGELPLGIGLS
tara:strand:+ start:507 stop:611 length:105 start_codon:yes stop_codon:yes gene_type:complete